MFPPGLPRLFVDRYPFDWLLAEHVDDFLHECLVAFGGDRLGKLPPVVTKEDLLKLYAEKHPEEKEGSRASWASQLLRMVNEMKIGDDIACFDRDRRRYVTGKVTSNYEWLTGSDEKHARFIAHCFQVERGRREGADVARRATRFSGRRRPASAFDAGRQEKQ